MERHYDTFRSRLMERPIEYLWFGSGGRPLVMFPTAGGRFFENEDRNLVGSLAGYINEDRLQVCCIDSFNDETWNHSHLHPAERVRRHDIYDRYLAEELLPMVAARAGRGDIAVYGASQGGFHAVNVAARHPEQVSRCIALSGLFDTHRLLDGHWDDLCYFHCPTAYVANMDEGWVRRLSKVEWIIATGEHDSLVGETRNFSSILRQKGIPVHSEIWPGVFGHDWPFWKEHLRRFLP
ncbi:MAG: alpha/beta fold hydrolase [Planctomycetota bacterium]|jgi:esterase/lipase superfamily enzyme